MKRGASEKRKETQAAILKKTKGEIFNRKKERDQKKKGRKVLADTQNAFQCDIIKEQTRPPPKKRGNADKISAKRTGRRGDSHRAQNADSEKTNAKRVKFWFKEESGGG